MAAVLGGLAVARAFGASAAPPPPIGPTPNIILVYRDVLVPGRETAYRGVEIDAAVLCAKRRCPNPYLAIESVDGTPEVWFLNGYRSVEHEKQVADRYRANGELMSALNNVVKRKSDLVESVRVTRATRVGRTDAPGVWTLGEGRYLLVLEGKSERTGCGEEYLGDDGVTLRFLAAPTLERARSLAAAECAGSRLFAVRPAMSLPAREWRKSDPPFWRAE